MQPWSICVSVACAVKLCAHFNEVNVNILKPHKTKDSLPLNDTRTHTRSSHIQHNVHYTSHDSIRCLFAREFSTQKMSNPTQWFRSLSPSLAMFSSLFFSFSNPHMFKFDAHINTSLLCTMTTTIYGYDMQFSYCIFTKIPRGVHIPTHSTSL